MTGLVWTEDENYRWAIAEAPLLIEMTLSQLCGANNEAIHAEGNRLVVDNLIWYRPVGFDVATGVLELVKERDDRPGHGDAVARPVSR